MKQISKTEHGIKALNWLHSQRINHEFNWEKPTAEDHKIWEAMKTARVLVDRRGQECREINEYGPNPSGITKPSEINKMYLSSYSKNMANMRIEGVAPVIHRIAVANSEYPLLTIFGGNA